MATTYNWNGNGVNYSRASVTYYNPTGEGSADASITNLLGGSKWGGAIGSGVTLTTSFSTVNSTYSYRNGDTNSVTTFSPTQITAARQAMAGWAAVANIAFVETTDTSSNAGDIRWGQSNNSSNPTAYAWYPSVYPQGGDIWFGPNYPNYYGNPVVGTYGYQTYVHELGHALGLDHPHEGPVAAIAGEDQLKYSVMSYRSYNGDDLSGYSTAYYPTTPMLNDVLAIQFLYGANMSYKTGDDVYQWGAGKKIYETIWDAGGNDTINGTNQLQSVILDLRSGSWSSIGVAFWNGQSYVRDCLTIAYGAIIENATGSAFNDTLTGNSAANVLNGGAGADSMQGGQGDDAYFVNARGDVVSESENEGNDSVFSSVSYALGNNLENLTLMGASAIKGAGNTLDNVLTGNNGANILDGGVGADTLVGGLGNDMYLVDNVYDVIEETSNLVREIDTIKSSITWQLGTNLEKLLLTGAANIDGVGNELNNTLIGNIGANHLDGGLGADLLIGGLGNDTYVIDNIGDKVIESSKMLIEIDMVESSLSYALGANLENLTLIGNDTINGIGNSLANVLNGNAAANVLKGGLGADTLQGGFGNDTLFGGTGNDVITGGADADIFVFDTLLNAGTNIDTVIDFSVSLDKIWLDKTIFTRLSTLGTLNSLMFRSSDDGLAIDDNDYILYNTASGALMYDADGVGFGASIQFATLSTKPDDILASNFIVVA